MRRVLRNIPDSQRRVFVNRSHLRFCFTLLWLSGGSARNTQGKRTVRSLMSVDFPAPLGPTIPTRLLRFVSKSTMLHIAQTPDLDNDRAQLTFIKLGSDFPGYVKVQVFILRMARVLLRTPMREPGGGKENLTEVAAKV